MSEQTPTALDAAHAQMERSDADRLAFFSVLADAELFILLEREAEGDQIEPKLFPVEGRDLVLAFDTEARLAEFAQSAAAYVALPGRIVAQLLGAQGLGLGLNLDVASSAMVLEPDALNWLTETLGAAPPDALETRIIEAMPPSKVPQALLDAIAAQLTQAGGLAQEALLVEVRYEGGGAGHVLALVGAEARVEPALARAVNEALTFSGVEAGFLDVGFFAVDAPIVARLRRVALGFELPQPQEPEIPTPVAPGSDPDRPPKLR